MVKNVDIFVKSTRMTLVCAYVMITRRGETCSRERRRGEGGGQHTEARPHAVNTKFPRVHEPRITHYKIPRETNGYPKKKYTFRTGHVRRGGARNASRRLGLNGRMLKVKYNKSHRSFRGLLLGRPRSRRLAVFREDREIISRPSRGSTMRGGLTSTPWIDPAS